MAKVAIVTGGNRGIGKAIADTVKELGYEVHTPHLTGGFDVRDYECVKEYIRPFQNIDLLVNNAGICEARPIELTTVEFLDDIWKTNARGTYIVSKCALTRMRRGGIINVASIAGTNGFSAMTAYGMSKAAIIIFTKALAVEKKPFIKVNALCPAAIKTDMTKNVEDKYLTGFDGICKNVRYFIERDVTGMVI